MENKNTYYGYLDILRIVSAFAVVVIHVVTSTVFNSAIPITPTEKLFCSTIHSIMNFSVPTFIMITGFIFLGNEINYTYNSMKKYVFKIIIALILFGSFYSLLEQVFVARTFNYNMFIQTIYNIITGNLWDHLWYLYTILGMYLIIPIIKPFFITRNVKPLIVATALILICNNMIPEFNTYCGTEIISVIPLFNKYICYLFLGGLLAKTKPKISYMYLSIIGLIVAIILIIIKYYNGLDLNTEYDSLTICVLTVSFFVLISHFFKDYSPNKYLINISKATWGIYLLHPLFLNIQLKFLHINPFQFLPTVMVPLNCILLFIITYWFVKLLRSLSFVKKYIL